MATDASSKLSVKFVLLCVLLVLGLVIFAHLWWVDHAFGPGNQLTMSVESGLMISVLVLSITELTPEVFRLAQRTRYRGRFIRFFGPAAVEQEVRLVFAHRGISPTLKEYPWDRKQVVEGTELHPLGVTSWWALQDVRAAVYLSNLIHEMNGKDIRLTDDPHHAQEANCCSISIGLVSNPFTEFLGQYSQPEKLFIAKPSAAFDGFSLACDCPKPTNLNEDLAIVARIVPRDREFHRVWFVCAGRTAAGTAAAGHFLARNWPVLDELYKKHKQHGADLRTHSLAVAIKHRGSETMEADLFQHLDDSGGLYLTGEDQPVACWSPALNQAPGQATKQA